MKKQFTKLLFLFALLLTVSTTAWAEEVSFIFTGNDKNCGAISGEVSGISFETGKTGSATATAYNATNGLVLYGVASGGGYFQTTEPIQGSITQIVVTTNKKKNSPKYSVYGSTNGTDWTQIGDQKDGGTTEEFPTSADYTYIKIANTTAATAQLGINSIVITYTPSGAAKADSDFALVNAPNELNFDLYPNPTAQVINYTTSSTGDVTVSESKYVDAVVDPINKTITVTPVKETPSAQTITVSQAADDTYKAGTVEFTVSIANSAPYVQPTDIDIALNNALFGTTYNGSASGITNEKPLVGSQDHVTVTYAGSGNHYVNNSQIRLYPSNELTFEAPSGYKITKIVFTEGTTWTVTITADSGEYMDGSKTWEGGASSVVFTGSGNSGHCQMTKAAITLDNEDESDTRLSTTTTIDGTGITNNNRFKGTTAGKLVATVSTEDNVVIEGAAITWSGDNDEVATIDADGNVTLVAAGEVTFTADYAGDDNHKDSKATYKMTVIYKDITVPGATAEKPYTVDQAFEAIDTYGDVNDVYATGIVSEIVTEYSTKYGNISYNISADGTTEGNQLQAFRGKSYNGVNFTSENDIKVGDKVVIYGNLTKYGSTYEFAADNKLVSLERVSLPEVSITAAANATWVAPANVQITSDDVQVYTVTYDDAVGCTRKHEVADKVVPANGVVLLTSKGATPVTLEITAQPATKYKELANDLKGSDGTIQGAAYIFCLAVGEKGLGFYPVSDRICVPAGKAYLKIGEDESPVEDAPSYIWFNGDTTAIDSLTTDTAAGNESGEIYSLTGQRVGKNYRGIVIMNGRKVLKK